MDQNQNDNDNLFKPQEPYQPPQEPMPGSEPDILPGGARVYNPDPDVPAGSGFSEAGARVYSTEPVAAPPPYAAPPPPYGTPPSAQPPKSNRTWLIVLIVLLVLCCCCVVFLLLMYFVLGDMILEAIEYTGAILQPLV